MNYAEYLEYISKAASYTTAEAFTAETDCLADIKAYEIVYAVAHSDIDRLIKLSGVNMRQFGIKYNISYKTVQNWHYKTSTAPAYLIQLLGYAMITAEIYQ